MNISAVILAAGKSTRMGQQKMLLPWGNTTVLGKVVKTLQNAAVKDILLVTNSNIAPHMTNCNVRIVINDEGEMLESIQIGLREQKPSTTAALVCLGDQPQVEEENVRKVWAGLHQNQFQIVVPSYQMRRGHPWLIAKKFWDEILQLRAPQSMRNFLNAHQSEIFYVPCKSENILQDLDSPADYLKYKP